MKYTTLTLLPICIALTVLFTMCNTERFSISEWRKTITDTQQSFYRLGRNYGVLSYQKLELRQLITGQSFSIDEVFSLADSLSEIYNNYGLVQPAKKVAK